MDTIQHFNIFYSWQSDLNKKANNHFIKECIEKAIKELKKEEVATIIPRLDKDTKGITGSPRITDTILSKIDASHLFISDISIINSNWSNRIFKKRLTPNPNVLFELGYALNRLTWDRMICLNNDAFSNIKDMPFDLQQNRISQYNFNGKSKKDEAKKHLTELLKVAIRDIIEKFDTLSEKEHQKNKHQHDIRVFQGLDAIINDTYLLDLLQHIANINIVMREDYRLLDTFYSYLTAERNQFLLPELNIEAKELANTINKMHMALALNLQSRYETWYDETEQKKIEQISYHLPDNEGYFNSYEDFEDNKNKRIDTISNAIFETIEKYKSFRSLIKKQLFI